jgi:hypothetical protein
MGEAREVIVFVGVALLGVAVVVGLTLLGRNELDRTACHRRASLMGYEWKYDLLMGCMVQDRDGHWWPLDAFINAHVRVQGNG